MTGVQAHTIEAVTHGRYLTLKPAHAQAAGLLVGFHGQAETAAIQMARLQDIARHRPWHLLSIQGLNRFYTRRGEVVAGWMTREDRELAIADNIGFVDAVVAAVAADAFTTPPRMVFCGFSQGAQMAYRAAAFSAHHADGVIALAGDVPPDVVARVSALPPVLIGRGTSDEWYTAEKAQLDVARLKDGGVRVEEHVFDDGHVWHSSFTARAGQFLDATGTIAGGCL
jgi:predicted esterase